jgi:hypothetical protein
MIHQLITSMHWLVLRQSTVDKPIYTYTRVSTQNISRQRNLLGRNRLRHNHTTTIILSPIPEGSRIVMISS